MKRVFDRAFEVAAATFPRAPHDGLAHPFGFGEHLAYQWRVSRDVWIELCLGAYEAERTDGPYPEDRLLGEPITVDETLPPNAMLLEPVLDYLPGSLEITIR